MTLLYHRHHLIKELLARLFNIPQPTVFRIINLIELDHQMLNSSTLADKGYIGLGLATPRRGGKACRTPADMKAVNRFINSRRAVVERVIAQV